MDKKGWVPYDDALLEKITRDLGPANFHRDARYVAISDPKEVKTVKRNFLMHKLGLKDGQYLDDAIAAVGVKMGHSNRQKHRAIFYYLLMQELNVVDHPDEPDEPDEPVVFTGVAHNIENRNARGKYLNVAGGSDANGANVVVRSWSHEMGLSNKMHAQAAS